MTNPKVAAALLLPIDYANVDVAQLATLNLAGMNPATAGTLDETTGATTGDDPRLNIQGAMIQGGAVSATDVAYLEYLGWGPLNSPYQWNGTTNTFTFNPTIVGSKNLGYALTQIQNDPASAPPTPPKIVSAVPPVVPPPSPPDAAPTPAVVTVQHGENIFQVFAEDVHSAIEQAMAFIKKIV